MSERTMPGWREVLQVHPSADLFPMMSDEELTALEEDIQGNGLIHKVVISNADKPDGTVDINRHQVIDGRNRLDAMERLGWQLFDAKGRPRDQFFTDLYAGDWSTVEDDYIRSANVHRRHLNAEQRRELIGKLLKAIPEQSNRQVAGQLNVDHKTVGAVRTEMESTGEIPQLDRTIGSDGKSRPQRAAVEKRDADQVERDRAECVALYQKVTEAERERADADRPEPDEPDDEDDIEAEIDRPNYRGAFLIRADQARIFAKYSGPVDTDVCGLAQMAADAWAELAKQLRAKLSPAKVST